jgi:transcriptional regulator with XRE-family HTH domain
MIVHQLSFEFVAEAQRTTAGALLVLARQDLDISQRELADRAGVAQLEIAKIESGKREPSIPTLQRILAGAGLELRLRLAPIDDHNAVLAARHARRSPGEQAALDARHQGNVAQFASNALDE